MKHDRLPVTALGLGFRVGLWVPALLAMLAAGLFVYGRDMAIEARLLASEGVQTTGTVTRRERSSGMSGDPRYYLRYEFYAPEVRRNVGGRQDVSQALYDRVSVGTRIAVYYAPSRPSVNALRRDDTRGVRAILFAGASLLSMAAAFLGWETWRNWRAMLRAARKGAPGSAWVTGWRDAGFTSRRDGKKPYKMMEWRGDAHNHLDLTGALDPALAERFPPGSAIKVWYDPKTGRGFWEEVILPGAARPPALPAPPPSPPLAPPR